MATRKRSSRRDAERHVPVGRPNARTLQQFRREVVALLRAGHRISSETGIRLVGRNDDWVRHAWQNRRAPCFVADHLATKVRVSRDWENPSRGEVYESRIGNRWEVVSVNPLRKRIKVKKAGFRDLGELEWNPSVLREMKQLQTKVAAQIRHDEGPSVPSQQENPSAFRRWLDAMKESRRQFPTNVNDVNRDPERRYYVYVIESIQSGGKRVLYVGQSAHTPSARLMQHKKGARYCTGCTKRKYAKGARLRLVPEFYKKIPVIRSRARAEKVERILARKLRSLGFTVEGGH